MHRVRETIIPCGSVCVFFYSLIEFYFNNNSSNAMHTTLVGLVIFCHILCIYTWIIKTGRFASLFVFFILYSLFSCVGQSISNMIGLTSNATSIYSLFDIENICYMLRFQFVCISSLNIGVLLYFGFCKKTIRNEEVIEWYEKKRIGNETNKLFLVLYYVCAAVVISYAIWQMIQRQTLTYSELYDSRDSLSPIFQFGFCILGFIQVFNKQNVKMIYFLWFIASCLFFCAGTRSMAVIYIGMLMSTFPVTNPRLFQKKYIAAWIVIGIVFFAFISVMTATRSTVLNGNSFEFNLIENLDSTSSEMGAAAKPILYTLKYVDNGGERFQTILYTLLHGIFPTSIMNMLGLTKWNVHLAAWVTDYAGVTWTGLGYSYIAEAYMNYGRLGWVFTFFYGIFIAFAENSAYRRVMQGKYLYSAIMLLILSKQIFFARGNLELIDTFYRYSLYIFIVWFVFKDKKIKNHSMQSYR